MGGDSVRLKLGDSFIDCSEDYATEFCEKRQEVGPLLFECYTTVPMVWAWALRIHIDRLDFTPPRFLYSRSGSSHKWMRSPRMRRKSWRDKK